MTRLGHRFNLLQICPTFLRVPRQVVCNLFIWRRRRWVKEGSCSHSWGMMGTRYLQHWNTSCPGLTTRSSWTRPRPPAASSSQTWLLRHANNELMLWLVRVSTIREFWGNQGVVSLNYEISGTLIIINCSIPYLHWFLSRKLLIFETLL